MGWLKIHPSLQQVFENLVQYSTSGVPQFPAARRRAALEEGDTFLARNRSRRPANAATCWSSGWSPRPRHGHTARGSLLSFFQIDGDQPRRPAQHSRIVDEANVGLAPAPAFGPAGEGYFRACFHRRIDLIEEAADRLARWIAAR